MSMPHADRLTLLLEFGGRIVLAALTFNYFLDLPTDVWAINLSLVVAGLVGYLLIQSILLGYALFSRVVFGRAAGWAAPVAALVDAGAIFCVLVSDPWTAPPTLLLLLIAVLNIGLRQKPVILAGAAIGAGLVVATALTVRAEHYAQPATYDIVWLLVFSTACVLYCALLAFRQRALQADIERFADQDMETQLLNRRGFNNAAAYLVPLHQRMQLPLTILVASLDTPSAQPLERSTLAKAVREIGHLTRARARRSDVIARLADDEIIFMLFDTPLVGGETLARAMLAGFNDWAARHHVEVRMTFGMVDVPEASTAIDQLIARARHSIQRAQKHPSSPGIVTAAL